LNKCAIAVFYVHDRTRTTNIYINSGKVCDPSKIGRLGYAQPFFSCWLS